MLNVRDSKSVCKYATCLAFWILLREIIFHLHEIYHLPVPYIYRSHLQNLPPSHPSLIHLDNNNDSDNNLVSIYFYGPPTSPPPVPLNSHTPSFCSLGVPSSTFRLKIAPTNVLKYCKGTLKQFKTEFFTLITHAAKIFILPALVETIYSVRGSWFPSKQKHKNSS